VKTRNSHAHADPHKIAGYYYYHSLYYAARALRRLGADAKGYVPKIVETLAKEQGSDGSWEDAPCGGKPYGTALGLLTLGALEGTLFPWLESAEAALEEGKAGGRPVLCFFADAGRDSADLERVLVGEELRATVGGFTCLKSAVRKEDPACRKAGVTSGPVVLVLDAREAEPWAKPLARLRGRRTAKVLQDELGRALEAFRGK
jgi:hypothetical protein